MVKESTRTSSGIRDIARSLGISIGTVDRALHDRSGVSPKTKARVLQMAERLGYKPNLAAQALKLNRHVRVAAVLPREIACFFDPVRPASALRPLLQLDSMLKSTSMSIHGWDMGMVSYWRVR